MRPSSRDREVRLRGLARLLNLGRLEVQFSVILDVRENFRLDEARRDFQHSWWVSYKKSKDVLETRFFNDF